MAQEIKIHQFHPFAAPGDAVTNHMLFIQRQLKKGGIEGEIFANSIKPGSDPRILPFEETALWDSDLILYHHSLGYPELENLLKIEVPKALIYHNITPPRFFHHDPHVAKLCELGRQQLELLSKKIVASFTVSPYNQRELKKIGYQNPELIPLFEFKPIATFSNSVTSKKSHSKSLLFVGRIARHKNQALLIHMLYCIRTYLKENYQLVLVGQGDPVYARYLKWLVDSLGLNEHVVFAGKVTLSELEAAYAKADAFVCASQHEGYGIPLVEAMQWDLPIFAHLNTGIISTLGDAGIEWISLRPHHMAEVIVQFLEDSSCLDPILHAQKKRLDKIALEQAPEQMVPNFENLVFDLRRLPRRKQDRGKWIESRF